MDNLNGVTVDGRIISVDHVKDYKRLVDNPDYVDTNTQQPASISGCANVILHFLHSITCHLLFWPVLLSPCNTCCFVPVANHTNIIIFIG